MPIEFRPSSVRDEPETPFAGGHHRRVGPRAAPAANRHVDITTGMVAARAAGRDETGGAHVAAPAAVRAARAIIAAMSQQFARPIGCRRGRSRGPRLRRRTLGPAVRLPAAALAAVLAGAGRPGHLVGCGAGLPADHRGDHDRGRRGRRRGRPGCPDRDADRCSWSRPRVASCRPTCSVWWVSGSWRSCAASCSAGSSRCRWTSIPATASAS